MKKLFLTSVVTISLTCPVLADNITDSNKGCTSGTLTVDSGTAALEADWRANTVGVTFYNGDNVYGDAGSCTYDDTLTLPTAPSKDGYTFAGWTVRAAAPSNPQQSAFDLSTWNYGSTTGNRGYTRLNGQAGSNETTYGLTQGSGEWAVAFTNGTVKGQALCSSTNGTYATAGTPDETGGSRYCWCKATSVDTGNGYQPVASSSWVFFDAYGDADDCASGCVNDCARYVGDYDFFRRAVFGVSQ